MRFGEIDFFFAATRRDVVRIEIEDLLVFFEGEIVAAAVVVTLRVGKELFHVLNFREKLRAHRPVEVTGLLQMGQHLRGRAAIRIILVGQHLAAERFGFGKFARGDALLREFDSAGAESTHRLVVRGGADDRIWQKLQRGPELLVRDGIILLRHSRLRAAERFLASRERGLPARRFALRDVIDILGGNLPGDPRLQNRNEREKKRGAARYFSHGMRPRVRD